MNFKLLNKYQSLLLTSFLFIILLSCKKSTNSNFEVEGKIENLNSSTLFAVLEVAKDSLVIDTIRVSPKGDFTYTGKVDKPTLVSLYADKKNEPIIFFLEPNYHVKINGDILQANLIKTKGGDVNDDLQEFKDQNKHLFQTRYRILNKKDNMDYSELKNVNLQLARSVSEFIEKHPDKIASVILIDQLSLNYISTETLNEDILSLKGDAVKFFLTSSLKEYYDEIKKSEVGAVAPDITLQSTKGKTVSIQEFRGMPLLLIFDLKEAPLNNIYFETLRKTQKTLKNKVNFVAILIDEDDKQPSPSTIKTANSLDWTILLDGKKWSSNEVRKYNVRTAPYMILISPEGIIQKRNVSLDSLVLDYQNIPPSKK